MRAVRQAERGETAWHVLRHNHLHQEPPRHQAYAQRLGLDRASFPKDLAPWQAVDVSAMLAELAPENDGAASDLRFVRGLCLAMEQHQPWCLGEFSLRKALPNLIIGWHGHDAGLVEHDLQKTAAEEAGHAALLGLLDSGQPFEPIIIALRSDAPVVFEGAHRTVAGFEWLRGHTADDLVVEFYYPCRQAAALATVLP